MSQLINRFGGSMQDLLKKLLEPMTKKVFEYVVQGERELKAQSIKSGGANMELSELGREVRNLRFSYYGFLHTLVRHQELVQVLILPNNSRLLENVLGALKGGILWWGQPQQQRDCYGMWLSLLEVWGTTVPPFRAYFLREIVPVLLQSPFMQEFEFEKGGYVTTLRMMCGVQHKLLILKEDFLKMLASHLNSLGCDDATKQQYFTLLNGENKETFIDWYCTFVRKIRKSRFSRRK